MTRKRKHKRLSVEQTLRVIAKLLFELADTIKAEEKERGDRAYAEHCARDDEVLG